HLTPEHPAARPTPQRDTLEIVEHGLDGAAEDVDGEGAEREGGECGVEGEGEVEACQAARRREDEGEESGAAPAFPGGPVVVVVVAVAIGWPDGHEDCSEPGTPC
ncbi:MAG: hypothetical protein Q9228_004389, partial [Teloschistes exilis]